MHSESHMRFFFRSTGAWRAFKRPTGESKKSRETFGAWKALLLTLFFLKDSAAAASQTKSCFKKGCIIMHDAALCFPKLKLDHLHRPSSSINPTFQPDTTPPTLPNSVVPPPPPAPNNQTRTGSKVSPSSSSTVPEITPSLSATLTL